MYQNIHIIGGGTFNHIRNHLSLATPAYGTTARMLTHLFNNSLISTSDYHVKLHLTKMADPEFSELETNEDVSELVDTLITDPKTKVIVFNVAMCDFNGMINDVKSGKYAPRLESRNVNPIAILYPTEKIIKKIRKERKDIFLIAFKTTCGATEQEQYITGLNLLKENSCNLVLANDTKTRLNMIIVPEEAKYCVTTDRNKVLDDLVNMTNHRSNLTYTRSEVVPGLTVEWNNSNIPSSLKSVVDYCIEQGAYKPLNNKTAGHFAYKVNDDTFYTSKRSTNFNDLKNVGLVEIKSTGKNNVIALGAKPSVGGMSQRIIFNEHLDVDCIVHFHCPLKMESKGISVAEQWPYECGSHECGQNTSDYLMEVEPGIKAVMLDEHGPNIVFNKNIDPNKVIQFIDKHFDLSQKTGGLVTLS